MASLIPPSGASIYSPVSSGNGQGNGLSSTNLSKTLAQLIQQQIAQLKSKTSLPKYDFSNLYSSVIDPGKYATGSAEAQFGSQIADLQHQLTLAPGQYNLDQSNIKDWFAQALNTYNKGATEAATQGQNAVNNEQNSAAALISALGGSANSANPGIAEQALIGQNQLQGNNQADNNLNAEMQGLIPLSEAQAHVNETGRYGQQMSGLNSQLTAAKSGKAAAYEAALQDATGKQFDQLSGIDNAKFQAAQSIFGDQMSKRQTDTSTESSIMNAILTGQLAPGQLLAQQLTNQGIRLSNKGKALANKNVNAPNTLNLSDPGQASQFEKIARGTITKTTVDPSTGNSITTLNSNPRKAWSELQGTLARYGVNNPQGVAFARSVFKDYLKGSYAGWFFDKSGKLTNKTEATSKPVAGALKAVGAFGKSLSNGQTDSSPKAKKVDPYSIIRANP